MQMGVAAELQIGEDDHHHTSTSTIWLNRRRSASCKGITLSNHCDKKSDKKASDHGNASNKQKKQLCLCAPTTHAGSFRCRLHRAADTANAATAHKPLVSSSIKCSGKKSFGSRNMAQSRIGTLDLQATLPRLSRFGRAAAAASTGGCHPISVALRNNEPFYQPRVLNKH
ncbi:unnamed protein product [Coffea canephora]|uniref:Uncharacterized protein n=1 Tax=Coffea canephora TaxID=49390 RepID=A0A068U8M0_COFCA|nr:uncharacterized protein LOC113732332 [Coffea arabica]CDP03958.1 unnamed protein product [Coffea canephora]